MSENIDAIDRYLQQMDKLKESQRLNRENEELKNKLKKVQLEDPLTILKTIIQNRYRRSLLKKEWIDSGLVDLVNKQIDSMANVRVSRYLRDQEQE